MGLINSVIKSMLENGALSQKNILENGAKKIKISIGKRGDIIYNWFEGDTLCYIEK